MKCNNAVEDMRLFENQLVNEIQKIESQYESLFLNGRHSLLDYFNLSKTVIRTCAALELWIMHKANCAQPK